MTVATDDHKIKLPNLKIGAFYLFSVLYLGQSHLKRTKTNQTS